MQATNRYHRRRSAALPDAMECRAADRALLDRLAKALAAADPPPPDLVANARRLLAWRTVDAELAELLCAGPPPAGG